ncbi:MAG: tetratricopeptide repeat protein [Pseudomonadota bacterium]
MLKNTILAAILATCLTGVPAAFADMDAGAYLAARQADKHHDFQMAARFFGAGMAADPANPRLAERGMTSLINLGRWDEAVPLATALVEGGISHQIAHLVLQLDAVKSGRWDDVFHGLERDRGVGPLVDGITQAWAHLGRGNMDRALASFDQVIEADGMRVYGLTHKAFALASVGDFEGAAAIFDDPASAMRYSRQSALAHAQILSQLGRNADAVGLIDRVFGAQRDARVNALYDRLQRDEAVAYDAVRTPAQAIADLHLTIAGILDGEAQDTVTLTYARAAMYLWPENTSAILTTAGLLEDMAQYELANKAYRAISPDDPSFHAAELGRAGVLLDAGNQEAAVEVLEALSRSHPDLPEVYATKGDTLRQLERFDDAQAAYTRALDLYHPEHSARWFVHYTRGISSHKMDNWPAAEADFRAALALRPDHPQVLNYLGYSLVERGEKLQEALQMIETAVAARPDNGAIVDSLGWVLFQLGQYEEAVVHLEHAASLLPVDPVINDHLGDALWAVGREVEARFQWQRALSFDPTESDAQRIRDKLARGLDLVLLDEGAEPLRLASGDD